MASTLLFKHNVGRASLFLSLITLFIGAFALFRAGEPKLCLNSNLISQILVTEGDENRHWQIPACEGLKLGARPAPEALWIPLADKAIQAVTRLEEIRPVLGRMPETTLIVDTVNHLRWERTDNGLILGFGWFDSAGAVEKSLLSFWVERVSPERNALVREIFVDQLWALLSGHLTHEVPEFENPVEYKNLSDKAEAFALPSFNFCKTPYIMLRQLPWCKKKAVQVANETTIDDDKDLSIWALRPVISSWLYDQISAQAGVEKIKFYKSWMKIMRESVVAEWRYSQPESADDFFKTIKSAQDYFVETLQLKVVDEMPLASENETLVELRDQNLKIDLRHPLAVQNVKFEQQNKMWMSPTWQAIPTSNKKSKTATHVILDCELPKASNLVREYSDRSENVVFIKSCNGSSQALIEQFLRDPVETVLVRNDKLEFVQFHMPSLAMAFSIYGKSIENSANWKNFFGWQELRRSGQMKATQPMAAIEAVRFFRWKFNEPST